MSVRGKRAIVTGGASGIGYALASQLAKQGAEVLVADVTRAEEAAGEIGCAGLALDVTDAEAVGSCIRDFHEAGGLDYLFNNAGVIVIGECKDMDFDDWTRVLDVNVRGVVNGVFAAYPLMIERGRGHIVNTASVAGLVPTPGGVPYAASKHAVLGLSTSLRAEAKQHGVQVTAICPGFIRTPMADGGKMVGGLDRTQALDAVGKYFGWMTPEDLAEAALRGVERNQAVVVAPTYARVISRWARAMPGIQERFSDLLMGRLGVMR